MPGTVAELIYEIIGKDIDFARNPIPTLLKPGTIVKPLPSGGSPPPSGSIVKPPPASGGYVPKQPASGGYVPKQPASPVVKPGGNVPSNIPGG